MPILVKLLRHAQGLRQLTVLPDMSFCLSSRGRRKSTQGAAAAANGQTLLPLCVTAHSEALGLCGSSRFGGDVCPHPCARFA